MNVWKAKPVEISHYWRRFWTVTVVLALCLTLFCSSARALYDISNTGSDNVYGLSGINARWATGPDFGTVSAEADDYDAYGLYNDSGDVEIVGNFGSAGRISATTGDEAAYGLYTSTGNIRTEAIDGTIEATSGAWRAVGLFAENGSILTEDIGGTITIEAWGSSAFGLRSDNALSSIVTGDITGDITVTAGGDRAYGFRSYGSIYIGDITSTGSITATATGENTANGDDAYGLSSGTDMTTGAINGTITATADNDNAYGLASGGSLTTGAINGTISATATNGSFAYGMYGDDITVNGDIGYDAHISATAGVDDAYGLYSSDGSITINGAINGEISAIANTEGGGSAYGLYSSSSIDTGVINGTISAEMTNGSYAYGMYAVSNITTGTIGSVSGDTQITATADGSDAYGLRAGTNLTVDGDIGYNYGYGGTTQIDATAGTDNAYGLYAGNDLTIDGDIGYNYGYNGYEYGGHTQITATATDGSNAYALYAGNDLTVGDIGWYGYEYSYGYEYEYEYVYGGDTLISATAGTDNAYALYAGNDLTVGNIGFNYEYGYGDTYITATASGSNAYALYAGNDLTVNGDIGYYTTISATAGDNDAAGLYSSGGSININGVIDGTITATVGGALVNESAYGLYAYEDIDTGAINGTISAEMTNGSGAYGMRAENGDITIASIGSSAEITALAGVDDAYGLSAYDDITITGAMNGSISATTTEGSGAYGMYAGDNITIGSIGSYADITASADDWRAVGLYADEGDINVIGNIAGAITATAGWKRAYGLNTDDGSIIINGDISSTALITVHADEEHAYGLYSKDGDINIIGAIRGTINTTSADRAAGLYSENGDIYTGNIIGDINSTAGYRAYGLFSQGDIITGDISGTIKTTVTQQTSYALLSWGDMTTGDIDGDIIAKSGVDNAVGLYSQGTLTTGRIRGNIDANAGGDYAYGILAYDSMNVTVDGGTISAVANGTGATNVAAIQSGRITVSGLSTQDADDTVEIVAGSTIIGAIDLASNGTDRDLLLLSGDSWDSTVLDYNVYNVEDVNITGGTWHVNGSIINNLNGTKVFDEGILMGTGTLENLYINDGGTLNPGNSIGTINVTNLTIDSGGTYEVEVDDSGAADKVNVSGTANLDGTIRGVALERLSRDNQFSATVIDAPDDGLNDTYFATVAGNKLFLEFSVDYDYDAGDVILNVDPLSYGTYGRSKNERSVGHALDDLVNTGQDTGEMDYIISLFDDLEPGDEDAANAALDQMMPQDVLGLPEVTRNIMSEFSEGIFDHMGGVQNSRQYAMMGDTRNLMANASNSPMSAPQVDKAMPYAKAFGTWANRDGEKDVVGYDYDTYGAMAGLDKLISENTLVGFGIGGAMTDVDYDQPGTSADIDSLLVSLYGSYFQDNWHIGLTLGYSHNWYDAERKIDFMGSTADAEFESDVFNVAAEFGNNFGGDSMLLEPVVGVGYTYIDQESYEETGAGALNLKVDSDTSDGIYSKLGLRWAKEFRSEKDPDMVFVPKAHGFWIHDFTDNDSFDSEFVNGGSFTTESLDPVEDSFNVGAGLDLYLSKGTRLFVDYAWQGSSDYDASTVHVGAQWTF